MAFRVTEGSLASLFGAPTFKDKETDERAQQAKLAATQLALQNLTEGDPRIEPLQQFMEQQGQGAVGAALIKQPSNITITQAGRQAPGVTGPVPPGMGGLSKGDDFSLFSVPKTGAGTGTAGSRNRREKIEDLMRLNTGLTERQAVDVVDKNKVLSAPDKFGNLHLVSRTSGTSEVIAGPGAPRGSGGAPSAPEPTAGRMSPAEAAREGTGPVANTLQTVSNLFGFLYSGQIAPKTVEARQTLGLFNKTIERVLINNPRFPVAEQNFIRTLVPNADKFFKDPDDAVANTLKLESYIDGQINIKEQEFAAPGLTSNRKAELSDQISALREVSRMFPQKPATGRFGSMSRQELGSITNDQIAPSEKRAYLNALKAMR